MSVGYLGNGACWSSVTDLAAFIVSDYEVTRFTSNNASVINSYGTVTASGAQYSAGFPLYYTVTFSYANGNNIQKRFYAIDCEVWAQSVPMVASSSSGVSDFWDGYTGDDFVEVGWLIAGLWIAAYAAGHLVRFINEHR